MHLITVHCGILILVDSYEIAIITTNIVLMQLLRLTLQLFIVFTTRRYASAVFAVILSVCLSVTSQHCTKTAKHNTRKQCYTIAQGL